jgi:hypothetical protein
LRQVSFNISGQWSVASFLVTRAFQPEP